MIDELYSARILGLAANIPRIGRLAAPAGTAEKVSRVCGSRVTVDLMLVADEVSDFAQDVQACALGQAAAAVLGAHVIGASVGELTAASVALKLFLADCGPAPHGRFAELSVLQAVKAYPARHASACLAFDAAVAAARKAMAGRTRGAV